MTHSTTIPSLQAMFRFPFEGPDWQGRFLIGAALILAGYFIPILPTIFVYGYVLAVMRQALAGEELVLPAWDDWGKFGLDGLRGTLVSLAYLLPATVVFFGGMALYFVSTFTLPFIAAGAEETGAVAAGVMLLTLGGMAILFLSMFLGSLLLLLGAVPLPLATAHFVAEDKLAAAFRLREWWPLLRANKLGYFITWVVVAGLLSITYFAIMLAYYTCILCCLIPLLSAPLGFYLSLVGAALFGGSYRQSQATLDAADEAAAAA